MPRGVRDLTGQRFGRVVLDTHELRRDSGGKSKAWWSGRCDCGERATASAANWKSGNVRSCGCLAREVRQFNAAARRQHGRVVLVAQGCTCGPCEARRGRDRAAGILDNRRRWVNETTAARSDRIARSREYYRINGRKWTAADRMSSAARTKAIRIALQAATRTAATRAGSPWAPTEDALVRDRDLTARELAFMLGRSYSGVVSRRAKLLNAAQKADN